MNQLFNYKSFVKKLDIKKNDTVLINSNFLNIFLRARAEKKIFNFDMFIEAINSKVGPKGTIIIPAYSWEFCKTKNFDFDKTKSICGSLPNYFIGKKQFKRTNNPIYSFLVAGKDKKKICSMTHKNSFSLNSPFGYLIKNKGKNLFFDIPFDK